MKRRFALLLIITIFTLTFIGCSSSSGENTVKNFITSFYSINQDDFDYYQKMINGATPSEVEEFDKAYETNTKKFEQYLCEKSYNDFYATRFSYLRVQNAFKNNYFAEVKNLKLGKTGEDTKRKTITYHYEFELNQINKDSKKTEVVKKSGTYTVINENDTWKILDGIIRY